jgi:hypothetical protein
VVVDEADFACDVCAVKSNGKTRASASSKSPPTPAGNRCRLLLGAASSFVGLEGSSVGQSLVRGPGRACIGLSEESHRGHRACRFAVPRLASILGLSWLLWSSPGRPAAALRFW